MTTKQKIIIAFIILFLLTGDVFLGIKYFDVLKKSRQTQNISQGQVINEKVLDFTKLFIKEVLKAEKEIDLETRLKLETAVRDLGDEEILNQWQKFVNSKTEAEAQIEVKNLLELLIDKIKIE